MYISAVTVPSGKSLSVTNNGTLTLATTGTTNATITNGTTTITSESTTAGVVKVAAKITTNDTNATSAQTIVTGGLWNTVTMVAANTAYYGRVTAAALTVTTSSTNTGMDTYFTTGSSSDNNVTITPKYTNTAGFKTANSTATNNGGTTYWKIKTANPAFDGGALNSKAATATFTNVTTSTTNNGISVLAKGTAGRDAVLYNGAVEGWVSKADNATASGSVSASTWNGTTYYITAITVPVNKPFAITTTADTELDSTSTLTVTNNAFRNTTITNAGTVFARQTTSGTGNVYVRAYGSSTDILVVENGTMKTTSITQTNKTTVSGTNATRATAPWGTGWISEGAIGAAVFGNVKDTNKAESDYVDISNTTDAPVLSSGGYLYINRGYVDDLKISLAKLVPNEIDGKTMAPASFILTGYAAFDGNGNAINGTMAKYDGTYSIT